MKVVGLTGGIGSGKTTVATMFKKLGIAVYIADDEAFDYTSCYEVDSRYLFRGAAEEIASRMVELQHKVK